MATTITIGTGGLAALTAGATGLAALAGGAALAGAIGLGVAGLAASLAAKSYRGHGGGGGGGYGGGHGGYGYRSHGHGYGHSYGHSSGHGSGYGYRGKRSAEDESEAIQNLLDVIRTEDVTGCGLRLVCELAGQREEELYEEELAILNLVGPVVKPGEGLLPPGGAGDYKAAKALGLHHGSCGQAFPMCPFNSTQLMGAVMRFLP